MNTIKINSASLNSKRLNVVGEIRSSARGEDKPSYDMNYFTLIPKSSVYIQFNDLAVSFKEGNGEWEELRPTTSSRELKGYISIKAYATSQIKMVVYGGDFSVAGNIMSLCYGDDAQTNNVLPKYGMFSELFSYNESIINAEDLLLPADVLSGSTYRYMFSGCKNLKTAPRTLPATTLAGSCYQGMFSGCTNLEVAPEILATTLKGSYCCQGMFSDCTKLSRVKALFKSISDQFMVDSWLYNVSPNGVFVKNAEATWDNETCGIPSGWTIEYADA